MCASRLQCEVKLQRQQQSDSQHLLQSLRVELQVYEKMKMEAHNHNGTKSFSIDVLLSFNSGETRQSDYKAYNFKNK